MRQQVVVILVGTPHSQQYTNARTHGVISILICYVLKLVIRRRSYNIILCLTIIIIYYLDYYTKTLRKSISSIPNFHDEY